jgi:hypothetical protein
MNRIADVVEHIVKSDPWAFVTAAEDVCKYNQQHLLGFADRVRSDFPTRFFQFIQQHSQ